MEVTEIERIVALERDLKHLTDSHNEVKAIALANQKLLRWALGASATFGAMLPIVAPKVMKLLGAG